MTTQAAYKSDKAREKALASYQEILAHWPVPYEERIVTTSFGETYVLISGSEMAEPLVLLHGGGGNSTMWSYNVACLSKYFRVFAIDIIGEAGKSSGTRPALSTDGYSRWLKEVFDALRITQSALCGASLGGTIAHQFALVFPRYVTSLVLLAPPSLFKMRPSFLLRALLASALPSTLFARHFLNYISSCGSQISESAIQAFIIQFQAYKPNMSKIPIISDHELAQLPKKTLVLIGQNEVLYDSNKVISKIRSAAPFITIAMIPGAKHTISADQPDLVNEKIIQFLM
jgi:pimeloyl-ACP methyl ester carboxylesterase